MKLIIILLIIGACSSVALLLNIRICPFYNIFKIPCPGCGLTRSIFYLFKLDLKKSLSYNILGLPILVYLLILISLEIIKLLTKKEIKKNKKIEIPLIAIAVILVIITWIININNPLLY